jgi:hypothetical protein
MVAATCVENIALVVARDNLSRRLLDAHFERNGEPVDVFQATEIDGLTVDDLVELAGLAQFDSYRTASGASYRRVL